jgi:hypothetical protein
MPFCLKPNVDNAATLVANHTQQPSQQAMRTLINVRLVATLAHMR